MDLIRAGLTIRPGVKDRKYKARRGRISKIKQEVTKNTHNIKWSIYGGGS